MHTLSSIHVRTLCTPVCHHLSRIPVLNKERNKRRKGERECREKNEGMKARKQGRREVTKEDRKERRQEGIKKGLYIYLQAIDVYSTFLL